LIAEHPSINVIREFLIFVTGTPRLPEAGSTYPNIEVRNTHNPDIGRLPETHTCFNQINMPPYPNKATIKDKLWTAMTGADGFGMP
jgi:hypothetical protein